MEEKLVITKEIIKLYENDNDWNKYGISNKITDFENWIDYILNNKLNNDGK